MENVFALDIETSTTDKSHPEYALQPFRLRQGKAKITSIDVAGPDNYTLQLVEPSQDELNELLYFLRETNRPVFCHNTVFDTSWMLLLSGSFDLMNAINWHDTGLLAKWLINSQTSEHPQFSFSLIALCKYFMPDHPKLEEFTTVKERDFVAGEDKEYWLARGTLDTAMTRDLAITLRKKLPESQRQGYGIEQKCIMYAARANVNGIPLDKDYIEELPIKIKAAKKKLENQMPISGSVISSSAQLSDYLFNHLGLTPISRGKPSKKNPQGAGSTKAGHLKRFRIQAGNTEVGDLLGKILDYKQLHTLESKYINGLLRVMDYTGEACMYPTPRVFGTYTGRFTYGSMIDRKQTMQYAIACHQLPKKGPTKKCLVAPEGMWISKNDGAQQELRIIGCVANDNGLITEFNSNMDVHSTMSAFIANMSYEEFMSGLEAGKADIINYRYAGKLLNLSCQYRIGAKSLMEKFFETYGIIITENEAYYYLNLYKERYPGVKEYWTNVCHESEVRGYTKTFADRRYYINEWGSKRWQSESSAINFPIQGSAADHKELTLMLVSEKFPEIEFFLDVHDELCFYVPKNEELVRELAHTFVNLSGEYRKYWDSPVPIDLPFDTVICKENFKDGKEIHV